MNLKRTDQRNQATSAFWRACRVMRELTRDETGVTAIEYALLASLIAIVASAGIGLLGVGVSGMWTHISDSFFDAL